MARAESAAAVRPALEITPAQKLLIIALTALTVVRWIIAAHTELTPHEALLYAWGMRPSAAGYDGGGGAALLVRAGTAVFGKSEFGVRFFAPLCAAASSVILYRLTRSLAGEKSAAWAVALVNVTPLWNLGAVFMRPETPAVLLCLAGTSAVWRGLRRASGWSLHWPLAGLLFGLGWLCWYGAAAGPAGAFLLLAASRRWRGQLRRPGPWLMLLDFLVFLWPLWQWNAQNAWAGWHAWRESAGLAPLRIQPLAALRTWGVWLLAAGPVILPLMLHALRGALLSTRDRKVPDAAVFASAFVFAAGVPAVWLSLAGGGSAAALAPALPMLAILLAWWWEHRTENVPARLRWQAACVFPALVLSVLALQSDLLRYAGVPVGYTQDASRRWRGWRRTAAEAESVIRAALPQAPHGAALMASDWRLAAMLNFYLPAGLPVLSADPRQPVVMVLEDRVPASQFSYWPRADALTAGGTSPFAGRTVLLFSDRGLSTSAPALFRQQVADARPVSVFDVARGPWHLRRISVWAGEWQGHPTDR